MEKPYQLVMFLCSYVVLTKFRRVSHKKDLELWGRNCKLGLCDKYCRLRGRVIYTHFSVKATSIVSYIQGEGG
jgi:hypothetical protein